VRLKIDKALGLQVALVVLTVMPQGMRGKHGTNTVSVAKIPMQNRLDDSHQVVGTNGYAKENQDLHCNLLD